jgi:hypothetical protein
MTAIELLLKGAAARLVSPHREIVETIFGLVSGLDASKPDYLRKLGAKKVGKQLPTFINDDELVALGALADQIVADCFVNKNKQSISVASTPLADVPVENPLVVNRQTRRLQWARKHLGLVSVALAVVVGIVVAFGLFGDSDQPEARATADNLLRATVIPIATRTNLTTAFPDSLADKAKEHLQRLRSSGGSSSPDKEFESELDDGAYAVGGSSLIRVEIEGLVDGEVTITDVRLDNLKRDPLPLNALIYREFGGGDRPREMFFSLDQQMPVAMHEPPYAGSQAREFRQVERIGISRGGKETLLLTMMTQTTAATFNVAIDYEYEGKLYTQTLYRTSSGRSFRMAPQVCGRPSEKRLLVGAKQQDLDKVRSQKYANVYLGDDLPGTANLIAPCYNGG